MTPENMKERSDETLKSVDRSVLRYIGKNYSESSESSSSESCVVIHPFCGLSIND